MSRAGFAAKGVSRWERAELGVSSSGVTLGLGEHSQYPGVAWGHLEWWDDAALAARPGRGVRGSAEPSQL